MTSGVDLFKKYYNNKKDILKHWNVAKGNTHVLQKIISP